jgi:hypothetical protein
MKVYVVAYGWDYQGVDFDSVKLFTSKKQADKYASDYAAAGYDGYDVRVDNV